MSHNPNNHDNYLGQDPQQQQQQYFLPDDGTQQLQQQQGQRSQQVPNVVWSNPFQGQQGYPGPQQSQHAQGQPPLQHTGFLMDPTLSLGQPPQHYAPPAGATSSYNGPLQQASHPHPQPQVHTQRAPAHQPAPTTKKRKTASQPAAPRRRTVMSCESCRMKKIKCDLMRPVCGSCGKSGSTCMYRSLVSRGEDGDVITQMAGVNGKHHPPVWSSCNWYSRGDGCLKWPIFKEKYKARAMNPILAKTSNKDVPVLDMFTPEEMRSLNQDLKANMGTYAESFTKNVSSKDPFINTKTLLRTLDHIRRQTSIYPDIYLFDMILPDDCLALPVLIQCCAVGLMSKTLSMRNLVDHGTSTMEKSDVAPKAFKLAVMAKLVNAVPKTAIPDFDLSNVQFYLLQAMFWMYNMKPLKAWDRVFKASTTVMTILESYKSSGRKFTEHEHRTLERVFHSCYKYESELRVELSPMVPSSGIVNYPFPSIYPTPPMSGSSTSTEHTSWFFFLTEIVIRKLENRFLDEFYEPIASANEEGNLGEFIEDDYSLDWGKYDVATIIQRTTEYLGDLGKIEKSMVEHCKPILQADESAVDSELQPHGFVLKQFTDKRDSSSNTSSTMTQTPVGDERSPMTPNSDTSSSNLSQRAELLEPRVSEIISFIKTRMIALKLLLFRPLVYLILHDTVDDYDNPFIDEVLSQAAETIDLLSVPIATHRHFGSWFYLRNTFVGAMLVYGLYCRFRERFVKRQKVKELLKNTVVIFDYWLDEAPDLEDPRKIVMAVLEELRDED